MSCELAYVAGLKPVKCSAEEYKVLAPFIGRTGHEKAPGQAEASGDSVGVAAQAQDGSLLRVRLTALKMPMPRKISAPMPM
jgi:hypothetical protein